MDMHRIDEPLVQCAGCFRMMPIQYARRCHRCWRLFHVICVRRHAMEGCAGSAVRLYAPVKESTYKYSLIMGAAIMGALHLTMKVMRWGFKSMGSTWKRCFFILLMFSAFTLCASGQPVGCSATNRLLALPLRQFVAMPQQRPPDTPPVPLHPSMLEDHYRQDSEPTFYDNAKVHQIPNEPWSEGDYPKEGVIHVSFYTSGRDYMRCIGSQPRRILDPVTGAERQFDAILELDSEGNCPIEDPSRSAAQVYGVRVKYTHDGACAYLKHKMAHNPNQRGLKSALGKSARVIKEAIKKGKSRAPVKRKLRAGGYVNVHEVSIRCSCASGRHRARTISHEYAKLLRRFHFTVTIYNLSLIHI